MRKLLGGVLLAAGVGGLGYWGAKDHAVEMEQAIGARAVDAVATSVHGVQTSVAGRDITVSGYADTEAERDTLLAALHDVTGRRVVLDELQVLPKGDPFEMTAVRGPDGVSLAGHVPSEAVRGKLSGLGAEAGALTLASGSAEGWDIAAAASVDALGPLNDGTATLTGQALRLRGTAATPVEEQAARASLGTLPEGYAADVQIDVIDDGIPNFTLSYDAGSGLRIDGKLPKGADGASVAQAMGVTGVDSTAITSFGADDAVLDQLRALRGWLPEFDDLTYARKNGGTLVSGRVLSGVDLDQVRAGLVADLGDVPMDLSMTQRAPADGVTRINAATGQTEVFGNGYWLPQIDFTPSLDACEVQSAGVLERAKVNFVTGSAQLDARSIRTVNALASVIRACVGEAGLALELGGHTDSTGNAEANMALSTERAEAVRAALVTRGVQGSAITAKGFGDTQPIASNDTDEGRAANRRTTITWTAGE